MFVDDVVLVSYPKSGRTWIRVMLARVQQLIGGNPHKKEIIRFSHDGAGTANNNHWEKDRSQWCDKRIILLIRDPRDVVVSMFFQATRRLKLGQWSDISVFIRDRSSWGIDNIITFYNIWHQSKSIPKEFLCIRYEDFHINCEYELHKILDFIPVSLSAEDVQEVVSFGSFKNMRKIEHRGRGKRLLSSKEALTPGVRGDEDTYKTRKGIVGGYTQYLSTEDLQYVEQRIRSQLAQQYGYGGVEL